ncbi:MAG TPA: Trm112 family protein [Longimicrobiales bacterium]|nr:Trm112 family protein [Longimicrobiales bacterium]
MHVALTDVLTCPHCGPGHGLILLPDEVRNRRVVAGVLGCADCRRQYPVRNGVVVFAEGDELVPGAPDSGTREGAERLGGLLGLGAGSGLVFLAGPSAADAGALSELVEHVDVVAASGPGEGPSGAPVSRIQVAERLPFQSATLRGVALTGAAADPLLEEGARVLGPGGRLLLEPAPGDARGRLEAAGLRVLGEQDDAMLATR